MALNSLLAFAGALILSAPTTPLADIFVDGNSASCAAGTGGVLDPVCSINSALVIAAPGDTIRIAPGTYFETLALGFDIDLMGISGPEFTIVDAGAMGSVVTIPQAVTVTIDGLTLRGGLASVGGGINTEGNLTLRNSIVSGNAATSGNCLSVGNCIGGGVSAIGGDLVIENSTISGNVARNGAGLLLLYGSATITNTVIDGNDASVYGGGLSMSARGGSPAVYGTVSLVGCTLSNNTAISGAGVSTGGVGLGETTFVDMSMTNCTISGNAAMNYGGGMRNGGLAFPTLTNLTVTDNSAGLEGGGVFQISYYFGATLSVSDSIIAGNTAGMVGSADLGGDFGIGNVPSFSLIGVEPVGGLVVDGFAGNQVGTAAMPLDPMLGLLQHNGGRTKTHALLPGSSAVDAGNPLSLLLEDQRGAFRPAGSGHDIGAFETQLLAVEFCNGDGGNQMGCTACPCMNNAPAGTSGGCLNSAATSARLVVFGSASVSLPPGSELDLRLSLSGAPPSAFCILNSGDGVAPGNMANPCFGLGSGTQAVAFDGLRCAIMNTRRHGGRAADNNGAVGATNNPWGGEGGPPAGLAQSFGGFAAGQTRYFQAINRDDPLLSCMRGLNTSQAVRVVFAP